MIPDYGIATSGSPLYAATLGVENLARSAQFYVDVMGLDVLDQGTLGGRGFEAHWRLPLGATAQMAVLADRGCRVGRLALIEFHAHSRLAVRNFEGQSLFGLVNLNFYAEDIGVLTANLERAGCKAWSAPLVHDMGEDVGQPIEVMLEGPDTVIVNLIELRADRAQARILRTAAYLNDHGGYNRCGSTAVATSAHNVRDHEKGLAFYSQVLGMSVRNDVVLQGTEMERFTRFPSGARARDIYLQGDHIFGKIAMIQPLNFECIDIVPRAVAPNIGYLAQSFLVRDLVAALEVAAALGADAYSPPLELSMPALGEVLAAVVRNPASGALHELIQRCQVIAP
jgi:catechol 2,3-dioxygenase-like lactoylglutathione lyase family enzyme